MTTKAAVPKSAPQEPTPEMLKDLAKVFKKHNWHGRPVGFVPTGSPLQDQAVAASSNSPQGGVVRNISAVGECPPGTSPREVSFQDAGGNTITKTICV
ncbi:MAG: hypothetical protein ABSG51_15250 [Terracidiphilus sp.]|jgi:hypothetical protein